MEKLKVLVAEDHKATQKLYDRFLAEEIFDRNFAKSGEEALDIYRTWKPELIILDLMLPEVSGYTVLKEIREDLGDKGIPIIISSKLASKDDILSCAKFGVQGYIGKPINWNEIGRRVLDCFQKAHPQMADRVAELRKQLEAKIASKGMGKRKEKEPEKPKETETKEAAEKPEETGKEKETEKPEEMEKEKVA